MAKSEHRRGSGRKRVSAEVSTAVQAALDKKAQDVVVLDLRDTPAFTDFFVVCSGQNVRQVQAIADSIEEALRAAKVQAVACRRLRPGGMDPDGLLHVHRPRVHAGDPQVLFVGAPLGRCRAHRGGR